MTDWLAEAEALARRGEPFAIATVVRCERPTSAKPGAKALIRQDGTVSGWIGGSCAEPVAVRRRWAPWRTGSPDFWSSWERAAHRAAARRACGSTR